MNKLGLFLALTLVGCGANKDHIHTEFLNNVCIKPCHKYQYYVCSEIHFKIDGNEFAIPKNFKTDLASIPRIAWPILSRAHSSLIRPAIVHDWLYRKTCIFDRYDSDLIFYSMLINDGVSPIEASMMYYAVRMFGSKYYNEDSCHG